MYGRCDPCSEREAGTGRLRREQAPVPCTPAMASDHRQSREHATTLRAGPPRRPADGQQRAALRREGDGTRSRGLINPCRRMFSTAPARGLSSWCLRASPKSTSAHQCPACAFGQKTTLRAPRWRSSRASAPTRKTSQAAQRTGGHRRVATRETTGDLATRRGAGDPETRAEWMKVSRCGHLRPAPVVVDACVRTEWEPPTLRSRALAGRLLDGIFPLQRLTGHDKSRRSRDMQNAYDPEVRERCRVIPTADRPSG